MTKTMDSKTLEHHLMTDPDPRNPDVVDAAKSDETCAAVLRDSQAFEAQLMDALKIPSRAGLAQDIMAKQQETSRRPELPWMLATAAAVTLTIGVVATQFLPDSNAHHHADSDVWVHLAQHWEHDGAQVLNASQATQSQTADVEQLLVGLGVEADPDLLAQVSLGKICPTPEGDGAHLVLNSDDGPITLIIMPKTQTSSAPSAKIMSDGQEAWLVALEHGSMAVIADPDRNAFEIARQLRQQVSVDGTLAL